MAEGTLKLRVVDETAGTISHELVARVETISDAETVEVRNVVIPATGELSLRIAEGVYNVQLFFPSGRIMQKSCEVKADRVRDLPFHAPAPKSRTSVTRGGDDRVLKGMPPYVGTGPRALVHRSRGSGGSTASFVQSPVALARRRLPTVASGPSVRFGATLLSDGLETWRGFGDGLPGDAGPRANDLDLGPKGTANWHLPPNIAGDGGAAQRVWAFVNLPGTTEAASIPAPWRCTATGELAGIDISINPITPGRAATSMTVHDPTLSGLLTYLGQGRLSSLRPMIEQMNSTGLIEEAILRKAENPLAACAAAYVGLAVLEPNEQERWVHWVPNLMSRFPWMPDGAIVNAHRMMLSPGPDARSADVLNALMCAYKAGIPYYSIGLQLMREMLSVLAPEEPLAADMLKNVVRISARSDPKQMFTVLRYPRG
jgi:hypothetical protein